MQKIIIWGTGNTYRILLTDIKQLEEKRLCYIEALVNKSGECSMNGYKVISATEISLFEYDYIVICAEGKQAVSILEEAERLGISHEKIRHIEEFLLENNNRFELLHENVVLRQLNVIKKILDASDEEINNFEWMLSCVIEYGIYPFEEIKGRNRCAKQMEGDKSWGILQIPDEFASFCCYLNSLDIENAVEVGVFKGRSSYFMCAVLSRKKLQRYLCIDIVDNMDDFERYATLLPALQKRIPSTTADYQGNIFDFVFIDADHSYDGSMFDYKNVGRFASKITAFHDIYGHEYDHENGGTVRMWKEVLEDTKDKEHKIFSKYHNEWMGIGCVIW